MKENETAATKFGQVTQRAFANLGTDTQSDDEAMGNLFNEGNKELLRQIKRRTVNGEIIHDIPATTEEQVHEVLPMLVSQEETVTILSEWAYSFSPWSMYFNNLWCCLSLEDNVYTINS